MVTANPEPTPGQYTVELRASPKAIAAAGALGAAFGLGAYYYYKIFSGRDKKEYHLKKIKQMLDPYYDYTKRRYVEPDEIDHERFPTVPMNVASPATAEQQDLGPEGDGEAEAEAAADDDE